MSGSRPWWPLSLFAAAALTAATDVLAQPPQVVPPCVVTPVPGPQAPARPPVATPPAVVTAPDEENQVDLKFRREAAPPGGLAQMKVYITEPKPISTGGARFSFDEFESIEGIAISTPSEDGYGVAVMSGRSMALVFVSPSATFGLEPDYPVLTVVGRVPASAPIGSRLQFQIDGGSLRFLDPAGVPYPTEFENGFLDIQPVVAVHDVLPGSADLPAGSDVTILGSGFTESTRVRFGETELSRVRFVSGGRIDVTLAQAAHLHGMRIRVENKTRRDESRTTYFAYHRTRRSDHQTLDALLATVVPIFPKPTTTLAHLTVAPDTVGVAIQNLNAGATEVALEWVDAAGAPVQSAYLTLPSSQFTVLSLADIFGAAPAAPGSLRVSSASDPIQVMGVARDAGGARPQLATYGSRPAPLP
jgi:hypothetical protein